MATEVDICNLALSYLGDIANVTSINPPDGSAQAAMCARFYPMARDELLEMHYWGFATTRVTLAAVASPASSWMYAYAAPADSLAFMAILDPAATDDYATLGAVNNGLMIYTPQTFVVEKDAGGNEIILTNQVNAVLRYTSIVTDSAQFSATFAEALTRLLASKLAGPLLKGSNGRQESVNQLKMFNVAFSKEAVSDSNERYLTTQPRAAWMVNR